MAEINQNVEMWAGEDVRIFIRTSNDIILDELSQVKWRLLETPDADETEIEKELGTGLIVLPEHNLIRINLDSEDTIELGGSRYFHEMRVWDLANRQSTIATGRVKINPSAYAQQGGG